ncbi:MAG: nucleotidyltransferase family protein [Anaerolineales bacterium]|nr:nucleotidyltransferase family protein [Anaerolineales bacterium]
MKDNAEQTLEQLRNLQSILEQLYKARLKGVFGSYARGEQHTGSDVDILVEFQEGATLFDLVNLQYFLEEQLAKKVDIVSERAVRPEIKSSIYNDLVLV